MAIRPLTDIIALRSTAFYIGTVMACGAPDLLLAARRLAVPRQAGDDGSCTGHHWWG